MTLHQDWRLKIETGLRRQPKKLTGPYIARTIERLELLLPHLSVGKERSLLRDDIRTLTGVRWSSSSISLFLNYMHKIGVLNVRFSGRYGVAISLPGDLTISPWASRREQDVRPMAPSTRVEETEEELLEEVDMEPMSTDVFESIYDAGEEVDVEVEVVDLDFDTALQALDKTSAVVGRMYLDFGAQLPPNLASPVYEALQFQTKALEYLAKIRSALVNGTNEELEQVVNDG